MSDLITQIKLSTGKTVQIPIFYKTPSLQIISKSSGILGVFAYNAGSGTPYYEDIYRPYTDAELTELWLMLSGTVSSSSLTWSHGPVRRDYHVARIAWVETNNGIELHTDMMLNRSTPYISTNEYGSFDLAGNAYFDDELPANPTGGSTQYPTQDFYESFSMMQAGTATWSQTQLSNVQSGSFYKLMAAYNGVVSISSSWGNAKTPAQVKTNIDAYLTAHPNSGAGYNEDDQDNPYGLVVSGSGGGDGDNDPSAIDQTDNVDIPDLPNIAIANNGFITIYNPTAGQLNALSQFLWSSAFDIDSFKKLFADPMQCIIGLGIVPVEPTLGGTGTVHFGDIDTHVAMPYLSTQFVQKSMGSVSIEKYVGCFMDYQPYTQIEIYLPYIGTRPLNPDDIMGDTITLTYNIDCLTGGCCAIISSSSKGVLYQFNGSCIANVPVTSINYSSAIQNAVSAIGSIATVGVGAATGAAPIAAMGVAGLAANAANAAVNSKPSVQRSGQMGGSAGLMSVQTPYLIITRPNMSVPNNLNKFTGNTANITMNLNSCHGFTMIDQIHLDGIACTDDEKAELMSILQKGVIF